MSTGLCLLVMYIGVRSVSDLSRVHKQLQVLGTDHRIHTTLLRVPCPRSMHSTVLPYTLKAIRLRSGPGSASKLA